MSILFPSEIGLACCTSKLACCDETHQQGQKTAYRVANLFRYPGKMDETSSSHCGLSRSLNHCAHNLTIREDTIVDQQDLYH